jgi:hypothetical protein
MSKSNIVLCSEFNAPDDFICIYSKEFISNGVNGGTPRKVTEKLFVYGGINYKRK